MSFGRNRNDKLGEGLYLGVPRDEAQLLTVLDTIGIDIESINDDEVRVLCPFHGNSNTSAMSVSIPEGRFMCFNPMCDEAGGLIDLVIRIKHCSYFEAVRIIDGFHKGDSFKVSLLEKKKKETLSIPQEKVEQWHQSLLETPEALDYIHSRQITDESIDYFKLGYSPQANLLVTPVFDIDGNCVGGVGRGVREKVFKNIPGTQTSHSLFNIHNAKKHSTAIICESNFDAVRIHQAGFPGVVATLGGNFSDDHIQQIAFTFERVIIMTDVDGIQVSKECRKCRNAGNKYCVGHDPGRELGKKIADKCIRAGVTPKWAFSPDCGTIYPNGAKDAGDMTDKQIQNCINNSISNFEYNTL